MNKKLTPKAINEVLDLAFKKLPFHVYLVMCDVGYVSLKGAKPSKSVGLASKKMRSVRKIKAVNRKRSFKT
jgi:hypothetical protein